MKNKKVYWKGTEQLTNDSLFVEMSEKEFPEYLPINGDKKEKEGNTSRRDFLKLMGFSVAAASLAACEAPVRKAIPYLNKPVDVDPGVANYYASTYMQGGNYASIVVKTREGRPIKIEGNKLSKVSSGGTTAQVEASVLSLYDKERLEGPSIGGKTATWEELDKEIIASLGKLNNEGAKIAIISNTILSPSTKIVLDKFKAKYPTTEVIVYDPISSYGVTKAHEICYGVNALPSYHFDKADVVVGFSADFLGTWINPDKFSKDFSKTRKLGNGKTNMSRHYQWEANLSLTGANADYRTPVKPSEEALLIANLYNLIASKRGAETISVKKVEDELLQKAASDLLKAQGKSLVVSGSNDFNVQIIVSAINELLGNYGNTLDLSRPSYFRMGNDEAMSNLVSELNSGNIGGVILFGCNPAYNHPMGNSIKEGLKKAKLVVSTTDRNDETTSLVKYIAPDHHYLESWNDANPVLGHYSLAQPTISPLFKTRQAAESLLTWAQEGIAYLDLIKNYWKENFYKTQSSELSFQSFWDKCLYDGVYEDKSEGSLSVQTFNANINEAAAKVASTYKPGEALDLVLYAKVGIGDGTQANNPWLQELPDPISKACWDNYVTVSQKWANSQNLAMVESNTFLVNLKIGGTTIKLPALVQPGQAEGTFGLALGYGRTSAGKVANNVGVDVYPLVQMVNGSLSYYISGIAIEKTEEPYRIPQTQTHHTFMGRENVIQESILSKYQKDPSAGRGRPHVAASKELEKELGDAVIDGKLRPGVLTLWKGHEYPNHHWGMAIDMNSCTGCAACVVSCNAENNVPVVGREEVLNRREMHWLRIDRYYSSDAAPDDRRGLEVAASNPEVTFQPMMCQQCNNAPCETVCPVAATTHSTEGLNQMTYNRCIGTRYCANNCPYKVRRFNWFKYFDNEKFVTNTSMNNDLGKMVLNPDVTVRSRGVMEKCTFCVQRIQAGKLEAKKEGRRPKDGEVITACAAACSTGAIVFGDLKDPESKVAKLLKFQDKGKYQEVEEERAYNVLEEIGVKPNVWYFTKIRNKEEHNS